MSSAKADHAAEFPNLTVFDHPLIQHKLTHMRDVDILISPEVPDSDYKKES